MKVGETFMPECPSREMLQQLLDRLAAGAPADAVADHVQRCGACQQALERLTAGTDFDDPSAAPDGADPTLVSPPPEPGGEEPAEDFLRRLEQACQVRPGDTQPPAPPADPAPPPHVAGYRIVRTVGGGAMGTVYEAEQENPRRAVALKVIRAGVASREVVRRFAREAHILGRLHHPGIAQVYQAGVADDGQPYFVMELVVGLPLVEYARTRALTTPARLELLARVADAVQHAHDHGVIHRDLKPANILVDETGQPRVLDFGVAHVADAGTQALTARTEVGQVVGTLAYMSPEQLGGDPADLDGRADVYALGVLLFELLAQRLPYAVQGLPLAEAARIIHDRDPDRLGSVNTSLRGDVETIAAKALEKDRARRYPSAAALAADLRHYLAGEPITARPASAWYQFHKFARRNKALVGGAAATFAALAVGLVLALTFALREADQRRRADQNARQAEAQRQEALRQAYRARLAAALSALRDHQPGDAARHLEQAPERLRNWEWHHLHARLDDSVAVVRGLGGSEFATDFCPTGTRVVSALADDVPAQNLGHASLWDARTGKNLGGVGGVGFGLLHVVPSPRGPRLWREGKERKSLHVYPLPPGSLRPDGAPERTLSIPRRSTTYALAVSPDAARFALPQDTATARKRIELFDAVSGKRLAVCLGHRQAVRALAFSPDGRRLASGAEDRTARLWDAATGEPVQVLRGHDDTVRALAFSPDGYRLVTGSEDGTLRQWDAKTGRPLGRPLRGHSGGVRAAAYSPRGRQIASGGADGTVRLWRAEDGAALGVHLGHTGTVYRVAYSADGRRLASAATDGTARVWEAVTRAEVGVLRGHTSYVYPVAYSPDGRLLASGAWDGTVRLWDAATGEPVAVLAFPRTAPLNPIIALAFSPDGAFLAANSPYRGEIWVWQAATGRLHTVLRGHRARVWRLAFSPHGRRLASVSMDHTVRVWDPAAGKELARLPGLAGGRPWYPEWGPVAYSPRGRLLATPGPDPGQLLLRDAATYHVKVTLKGHTAEVCSAAFSPQGGRLVTTSRDGTVRVWDAATGQEVRVLRGHTGEAFTAVYSPDGSRIASGGRDGLVRLWDAATGEQVIRLAGHATYVYELAFSPDGRTLASGSGDFTVRLWDTFPFADRLRARAQARALRTEADRLVGRLFKGRADPAEVVRRLREDRALSEPLRSAALLAVLRRAAGPR
jgi:WD40 repeat protein